MGHLKQLLLITFVIRGQNKDEMKESPPELGPAEGLDADNFGGAGYEALNDVALLTRFPDLAPFPLGGTDPILTVGICVAVLWFGLVGFRPPPLVGVPFPRAAMPPRGVPGGEE